MAIPNGRARENLEQRLIVTNGRPSGFDYLRLWLAISVVFVHSPTTTNGADPFLNTPLNCYFRAVLPMFFALSGFLVAGSLERCKTLLTFLGSSAEELKNRRALNGRPLRIAVAARCQIDSRVFFGASRLSRVLVPTRPHCVPKSQRLDETNRLI
jgi:hypothetical protein